MTRIVDQRIRDFLRQYDVQDPIDQVDIVEFVEGVVTGYIDALLWSESCHGTAPHTVCDHLGRTGDEMYDCDRSLSHDLNYGECDLSAEAYDEIREDVANFVADNWQDFFHDDEPLVRDNAEQVGHDFFLTRNGHGTGFWDRGLGERGERLTEASKPYGTMSAFVGDDELIYVGG